MKPATLVVALLSSLTVGTLAYRHYFDGIVPGQHPADIVRDALGENNSDLKDIKVKDLNPKSIPEVPPAVLKEPESAALDMKTRPPVFLGEMVRASATEKLEMPSGVAAPELLEKLSLQKKAENKAIAECQMAGIRNCFVSGSTPTECEDVTPERKKVTYSAGFLKGERSYYGYKSPVYLCKSEAVARELNVSLPYKIFESVPQEGTGPASGIQKQAENQAAEACRLAGYHICIPGLGGTESVTEGKNQWGTFHVYKFTGIAWGYK